MANFDEINEARRLLDSREYIARTYPHDEHLENTTRLVRRHIAKIP